MQQNLPGKLAGVKVGPRAAGGAVNVGYALVCGRVVQLDAEIVGPGNENGAPLDGEDRAFPRVQNGFRIGAEKTLFVENQLASHATDHKLPLLAFAELGIDCHGLSSTMKN